jgi:hypothetical protein
LIPHISHTDKLLPLDKIVTIENVTSQTKTIPQTKQNTDKLIPHISQTQIKLLPMIKIVTTDKIVTNKNCQ